MLEIRNVTKIYRSKTGEEVKALDKVSITFPESGMVFILGKSGSGKSTLLNVMGGLDSYDEGEFIIKGKSSNDFVGSDFDAYRNTFIGFIFQEYNVLDDFSVGANIGLALELQGKKATDEKINEILAQVDLTNYAHRKPNELSGGQKQRVAIARALVKEPQIIMADEPTGALDSNTGKQIFDTLKELSREKLVLVVSHDRDFAERYADRIIELSDGRVIEDVTKHAHAAKQLSAGVHAINDHILRIEGGYKLTASDLEMINAYLASSGGDVILSGDKRVNEELRSAAGISKDGSTNVFESTDAERDIRVKSYEKEKTKFIRSRLPMKNAVKMGSSGLKHKKFRLVMTVLLSLVAFAMFGLADTMAAYNKINAATDSIRQENINYAAMSLGVRLTTTRADGESSVDYQAAALNDADIAYLKNEVGLDFVPVYTGGYGYHGDGFSLKNNFVDFEYNAVYSGKLTGLVSMTDDMLASAGLSVTGRLPQAKGEIAISELFYRQLKEFGFQYAGENGTVRIDADSLEISGEESKSVLNKPITLRYENRDIEYRFTVVGVVNTGFDYDRYQSLIPSDDPLATGNNQIVDRVLTSELESVLAYSFHALGFVTNEDIVTVAEQTFSYDKQLGTYMYGWNANTYLLISRADDGASGESGLTPDKKAVIFDSVVVGPSYIGGGSGWSQTLRQVADSSVLKSLDVNWLDGTPRGVLGANEIVISSLLWSDMQRHQVSVTLTNADMKARVDALFGAGSWDKTDASLNYAERLVAARRETALKEQIALLSARTDIVLEVSGFFAEHFAGQYDTPITDAASCEAALLWYYFDDAGIRAEHDGSFPGYSHALNWEEVNGQLATWNDFLPQLTQMMGITVTELSDWDAVRQINQFFSEFNAETETQTVSLTRFTSFFAQILGLADLEANGYFLDNDRFVEEMLSCNGFEIAGGDWDELSLDEKKNAARQYYIGIFLSWSEYTDYEPYAEGATTLAGVEAASKAAVLKLAGMTEEQLLEGITFEHVVRDYQNDTTDTLKAYDFKIVGTFADATGMNRDLVVSDALYQDYLAWYEASAGEHAYRQELAPHEDGIWSFALAPLDAENTDLVRQLVTMSYDSGPELRFSMQNAVMNTLSGFNDFIEIGAKIFLWVGLGFALFASLLLMNFIAISISYKKREIGILRAVGARSSDVFKIFFSEALIIALINFLLAIVALVATTIALNTWMHKSGINISLLHVGVRQVALMLLVSVVVALLSSFLPVYKIAKKKPVDAIKDR